MIEAAVTLIVELISIPLGIIAEFLAFIVGSILHLTFAKPKLDEHGKPVPYHAPSNRWQILGYSLLSAFILSLIVGGICWLIWQVFWAAQLGFGIALFIGVLSAIKAAIT